ncbi:DNA cytosine methyltransferase [Gemmiger gallinarum]|uniref:DNA cytosine methyltransferase n=1 Tax=Gemmiger gallinarum TaxID=2779354 RepID=UPI0038B317D0
MKHLGDITKIHNPPVVDCITFGSPCQDLSIAGKRAWLAGERSGLFMEAVRIIKQMEEQSGGLGPTFAIWENVPGAFSSNKGNDFHAVLEELARIKEPEVSISRPENGKWAKAGFICGNDWSIAWRTFDAQFWGVPQRRRRIALVLDLGGQRAGEVLFERTGMSGDSEPSIPPWKGIAQNPARRADGYDRVVEHTGFTNRGRYSGVVSETLRAESHGAIPMVCAAFTAGQGAEANGIGWAEEQAPTLRTDGGLSAMPTVLCRMRGFGDYVPDKVASSVKARDCKDATDLIVESIDCRNHKSNGNLSGTIQAKENGGFSLNYINPVAIKILRWIVRRLTPTECERLQGYPDGWTDIGDWIDSKGKHHKAADSPRYKALGNSIALPQWWWITCKMARYLPEHATLGSLFDGIGGFPLVWETLHGKGTAVWAGEIEEFPIAVTKARFSE